MVDSICLGIYDPESPEFGKYALRPNTSKNSRKEPKVVTSVSKVTKQLEFQFHGDQDHMESPVENDKP